MPTKSKQCLNLTVGTGFVNISVGLCVVSIFFTMVMLFARIS